MDRKKRLLNGLGILWAITLILTWFGNGTGTEGIEMKGIVFLVNPIVIISLISYFIGINNEKYNQTLNISTISWSVVIIIEIITFLTWYNFFDESVFNLTIAFDYSRLGFYISFFVSLILYFILVYTRKNNYKTI